MNKRQIAVAVIVLLAALFAGRTLAQGPALPAGEYDLEAGQYVFNVPALAVTATPIPPTETPVPPTSTPVPAPATLTATPEGTVLPYAGAPLCPIHNDREWHALWDYDQGCHYNHEHKDNPHDLDDVFGTQIYEIAGGSISYPWQTPNENLNKHNSYGWIVRR